MSTSGHVPDAVSYPRGSRRMGESTAGAGQGSQRAASHPTQIVSVEPGLTEQEEDPLEEVGEQEEDPLEEVGRRRKNKSSEE